MTERVPNEPPEPDRSGTRPDRPVRLLPEQTVRHDPDAERELLAAVLAQPRVVWPVIEAIVAPGDFYVPNHSHVFAAMRDLADAEVTPHPSQVVDQLRRTNMLETVGGRGFVDELGMGWTTAGTQAAVDNARLVASYSLSRHYHGLAAQLLEAARRGDNAAALEVLRRGAETAEPGEMASSWKPVDLAALIEGGLDVPLPSMLMREDGKALIYRGRVHAFNAEPESGKSMLAILLCAERIKADEHALYLDFETDPDSVVERLLLFGVTEAQVVERFHYVRPDEALDAAARLRLLEAVHETNPAVVIVDGVAEVMAMNNWDENSNTDVAAFLTALPRLLEREGCTVVLIDHVVKSKDGQGRYARGAAHKLAGITAAFKLEVVRPFAVGQTGLARLVPTKDRHGRVRAIAGGGKVAEFELGPADGGEGLRGVLRPPSAMSGPDGGFRPSMYMERVSRLLEELPEGQDEISQNQVRTLVAGKRTVIDSALECLVDEGFVERREGARRAQLHRTVRPYREVDDPIVNPPAEPDAAELMLDPERPPGDPGF